MMLDSEGLIVQKMSQNNREISLSPIEQQVLQLAS